jgi:hypothetical protein
MHTRRAPLAAFLGSLASAAVAALLAPACGAESVSSLSDSTSSSAAGGSGSSQGNTVLGGGQATGGAAVSSIAGASSVCTSNKLWNGITDENMRPGEACISCHATNSEAPKFVVAGTVYPSLHEPADCNGSNAARAAIVVITDAQGVEHNVPVNSAGNFRLESVAISLPYHARVQVGSATRSMTSAQTSGDCNSCHTESGTNSAPGRITLP